jgi:Uma2 family endonuclease
MTTPIMTSTAPLTAAEYLALPEDTDIRLELQDGGVVVKPRPTAQHQAALMQLFIQLRGGSPDLVVLHNVDVDLQLVPPEEPGTVRVPDLVVLTRDDFERVRDGTVPIRAADLVLVGEILDAGSRRTDTVVKHAEYADAGIGHYWIVDLDGGPSLIPYRLVHGSGYGDAEPERGMFEADVPFSARVDLTRLAR